MRRREFIALLGGVVTILWPYGTSAQHTKVARVGVLVLGTPDPEQFLKELREGLKKVGYFEGQNIRLELRSAGGKAGLLSEVATELVALNVDIMITWQTLATQAAKHATNEIPIVMVGVGDPIETGLIASLAWPGGNITGFAALGSELAGKVVELVREALPSVNRVAVLSNAAGPFTTSFLANIERAARAVDIEIQPLMLRPEEDFDAAFAEIRGKRTDAVIIQPSLLRKAVVDLTLKHQLPSFSITRQLPAHGGLMSYSASYPELLVETAQYVDKILRGSKPADLPVAQPSKFALVINLKTAKAIGLTIPPSLLARADEVIE